MPKRLPISAVRGFAQAHDLQQVIVCAWDGAYTHVVTYGVGVEDCDQAAQGGDRIKKALGWPEDVNCLPSRVKRLTAENQRLRLELSAAEARALASKNNLEVLQGEIAAAIGGTEFCDQ